MEPLFTIYDFSYEYEFLIGRVFELCFFFLLHFAVAGRLLALDVVLGVYNLLEK